jgi:hypothetical protein
MVARTTPARRAISAMLASGSLAKVSMAARRMLAMLRSAPPDGVVVRDRVVRRVGIRV